MEKKSLNGLDIIEKESVKLSNSNRLNNEEELHYIKS